MALLSQLRRDGWLGTVFCHEHELGSFRARDVGAMLFETPANLFMLAGAAYPQP